MFKFFQKQPTQSGFTFAGNRPHIRVESELIGINKEEADRAFKHCKKERYGSKTFCVNFSAMPLYLQSEVMVFSLGHRLGTYICGKDV